MQWSHEDKLQLLHKYNSCNVDMDQHNSLNMYQTTPQEETAVNSGNDEFVSGTNSRRHHKGMIPLNLNFIHSHYKLRSKFEGSKRAY